MPRLGMVRVAIGTLFAMVIGAPALACTRPMSVAEMAAYSAQVLTVRVESVRSMWTENPRRIETEYTFIIEEALKGVRAIGERTIVTAPGGTVGAWSMRLCCAPEFVAGESYVVFLLPEYRTHPVVGMSRGAFHLVTDGAGERRVMSVDGAALVGLGGDGVPEMSRLQHQGPKPTASSGVQVVDVPRDAVNARAMTYDSLRRELAPVLKASRVFPAGGPVGQRVQADYSPVAMVAAQGVQERHMQGRREQQLTPVETAPPRDAALKLPLDGGEK